MIQGYSDESSAFPGDTITFRVSSPDASQFRIDFYRQGATFDFQLSTDWMQGSPADERPDDQDWSTPGTNLAGQPASAWSAYPFQIPTNWQTGVYIAMFIEGDGNGNPNPNQTPPIDTTTPDARSGKALFVVKNPVSGVTSQILYMLPLFTYAAYNPKGGRSVYQGGAVSLHRPGNGTGGLPWDADPTYIGKPNIDVFDPTTFRQTFVHWDAKFISWLKDPAQGYRLDYCTSLDIHNDDTLSLLSPYALVLSVGHDEYYSPKMRDHLEAYIANGGNMAFFSGNTSWWRVVFSDLQNPLIFNRDYNWYVGPLQNQPDGPNRPEDALTGVSYRNAGEQDYDRPKVGYTVQHTNLWLFENTGLKDGDTFGQDQGLVGYECDGTPFDKTAPRPVNPRFDPNDHTPVSFVILGTGDTSNWSAGQGNRAATMGMYTNNGTTFTAATTDWVRVVASGREPRAEQITRNVLDAFSLLVFGTWQITANGSEGQLKIQFLDSSAGVVHIQGTVAFTDQPGVVDKVLGIWDDAAKEITFTRGPDNPVSQPFTGFLGDNHPERELILAGWFTESDIPATAPHSTFGWFAEKFS